jgi:FKBP-type peptidyl-prolyl cis-trans isomerase
MCFSQNLSARFSLSKHFFIVALVYFLLSCNNEKLAPESSLEGQQQRIEQYLKENNIEAALHPAGFYYKINIENPDGVAVSDQQVLSVHYRLSTLGGDEIDRYDGATHQWFMHAVNAVVPVGLDEAMALLKSGEQADFYIPANLAFKELSGNTIAPFENIRAEVELREVISLDDRNTMENSAINTYVTDQHANNEVETMNYGLINVKLVTNNNPFPNENEIIMVQYTLSSLSGELIKQETIEIAFAERVLLFAGFNQAVSTLRIGEHSLFIIPSAQAYGSSVYVIPNDMKNKLVNAFRIPDYATLVNPFTVLLLEIQMNAIPNN